jgi:microcystin degradation protein MlrC
LEIRVGGKIDTDNCKPLKIKGNVKLISDGKYTLKGPVGRGLPVNMGKTAVLEINGVDLVITERRVSAYDPELFRSVGIEPAEKDVVVIKQGSLARASYGQIAMRLILMESPGWGITDYKRPIFPLDTDVHFCAS